MILPKTKQLLADISSMPFPLANKIVAAVDEVVEVLTKQQESVNRLSVSCPHCSAVANMEERLGKIEEKQ